MRRSTVVVLVVLGAALAGFAFSSTAERLGEDQPPAKASSAAGPQTTELGWRETYGEPGQRLVFEVEELEVLEGGWRSSIRLTNDSSVAWEVGDPRATVDRAFGLMLFASGDASELEERNQQGTLPPVRRATAYEPSLPEILEPGESWEGVISAPGALAAGSWVRVVFGTLLAGGVTPKGMDERLVWITDHTVRLRP